MNEDDFDDLLEAVVSKSEGWQDALIAAWLCVSRNQSQTLLLETVI